VVQIGRNLGKILIYIAFSGALVSAVSYLWAHFRSSAISQAKDLRLHRLLRYGRFFFHVAAICTISSAAFLLYLILTHQFQYTYVWGQSSTDLPLNLLISTFYAGQEGSFHLWALWSAVLGVFLLSYVSSVRRNAVSPSETPFRVTNSYEPQVMGIYTSLLTFLLFVLIIKSPYLYVWESFPNDVQVGFIPQEGRGLNPLLQNFWMTIHPPILFLGFTSLAIPFCFALAALMKNEYDKWVKLTLPWALFGGMILGFGIMLGGYWAYGVLGWGGYWGWDPVENSSFVPWLALVAGFHIMIANNRTNSYKKTSLFLCIIAYMLVLYSTFLTRSGILGDASVHSFVDPGNEVYLFLIVFVSLFCLLGIGMLLYRWRNLKPETNEQPKLLSRETALFIGSVTLSAAALVILVGTSWPIIAKATVEPEFYNRMNLPIAILISVINGLSILLKWKYSEEKQFLKSLVTPLVLSAVVTIFLVIIGVRDFLMALFAASALFAFFINGEVAINRLRKNKVKAGPYIAHVGIALLFLGIIGSGRYSEEVNVSLPLNETKQALGFTLTYKGATPIPGDESKYHFNVVLEKDGRQFLLQPVMYYSEYSEGVMKNPDIANLFTKDVYLSPMSLEVPEDFSENDIVEMSKGDQKEMKGLKIKFLGFDMSGFDREKLDNKVNIIAAKLQIEADGKTYEALPKIKYFNGMPDYIPAEMEGNDKYAFYLINMSVKEDASIQLAVVDKSNQIPKEEQTETLVLTASIKPYINLVWGGTVVLVIGFFLSILKRRKNLLS
jgi:cytochrome c-type biogenesis protein CcmF